MLCEVCGLKIIKIRSFHHLFDPEIHHICESCYAKSPIHFTYEVIPIDDGTILWYNLSIENMEKPSAYQSFLASYYLHFIQNQNQDIFLYFDAFTEEIYTLLDTLKLGDVMLLTLCDHR